VSINVLENEELRMLTTIGIVWLEPSILQTNSSPHFSSQPSHCFIIPLRLSPKKKLQIHVLLDFEASAYFLDVEFIKHHKIFLVKKPTLIHVEAIDSRA